MPRVLRHTPRWLSRPAPGFALFQEAGGGKLLSSSGESNIQGPTRTIASRATEVFVAVGNELRWSDLLLLKEEDHDARQSRRRSSGSENIHLERLSYRVCSLPPPRHSVR